MPPPRDFDETLFRLCGFKPQQWKHVAEFAAIPFAKTTGRIVDRLSRDLRETSDDFAPTLVSDLKLLLLESNKGNVRLSASYMQLCRSMLVLHTKALVLHRFKTQYWSQWHEQAEKFADGASDAEEYALFCDSVIRVIDPHGDVKPTYVTEKPVKFLYARDRANIRFWVYFKRHMEDWRDFAEQYADGAVDDDEYGRFCESLLDELDPDREVRGVTEKPGAFLFVRDHAQIRFWFHFGRRIADWRSMAEMWLFHGWIEEEDYDKYCNSLITTLDPHGELDPETVTELPGKLLFNRERCATERWLREAEAREEKKRRQRLF